MSTEPDVTFVSFAAIEQGRVHFGTKANREDDRLELHGTPVTLERAKNRVGRWMYRLRAG